jgi:Fis family transcriptional regulator
MKKLRPSSYIASLALGSQTIEDFDKLSLEGIVEFKISRFLDQIGDFCPDNLYDLIMAKTEKPLLSQVLQRTGGNQVQAAKMLGLNRNTLRKKIKHHGL